jgi:hypothetical protein
MVMRFEAADAFGAVGAVAVVAVAGERPREGGPGAPLTASSSQTFREGPLGPFSAVGWG